MQNTVSHILLYSDHLLDPSVKTNTCWVCNARLLAGRLPYDSSITPAQHEIQPLNNAIEGQLSFMEIARLIQVLRILQPAPTSSWRRCRSWDSPADPIVHSMPLDEGRQAVLNGIPRKCPTMSFGKAPVAIVAARE